MVTIAYYDNIMDLDQVELCYLKNCLTEHLFLFYYGQGRDQDFFSFFNLDDFDVVKECIQNKTVDEIMDMLNKMSELHNWQNNVDDWVFDNVFTEINKLNELQERINNKSSADSIEKEIVVIKDNVNNTNDVVKLLTDADKNKTSLEEQNKEINNRLDKLETSISHILKLLQKVDFLFI